MANYYRLQLNFRNIPASSQFSLTIYGSDSGSWSVGSETETEGGLKISAPDDSAVSFANFTCTAKQMIVYAGEETANINVGLYVHTDSKNVGGEATLPPGAHCEISSAVDQTNVQQSGSWGVKLAD